jgi:hypothetical protein
LPKRSKFKVKLGFFFVDRNPFPKKLVAIGGQAFRLSQFSFSPFWSEIEKTKNMFLVKVVSGYSNRTWCSDGGVATALLPPTKLARSWCVKNDGGGMARSEKRSQKSWKRLFAKLLK